MNFFAKSRGAHSRKAEIHFKTALELLPDLPVSATTSISKFLPKNSRFVEALHNASDFEFHEERWAQSSRTVHPSADREIWKKKLKNTFLKAHPHQFAGAYGP